MSSALLSCPKWAPFLSGLASRGLKLQSRFLFPRAVVATRTFSSSFGLFAESPKFRYTDEQNEERDYSNSRYGDTDRKPSWSRASPKSNYGSTRGQYSGSNSNSNTGNRSRPQNPFMNLTTDDSGALCNMRPSGFPYTEPPNPPIRFDNLTAVDSTLLRAIEKEFKYETCSDVQASIFNRLPLQKDALVQAKTGTGKTLAFLIPTVNVILENIKRESDGAMRNKDEYTEFDNKDDYDNQELDKNKRRTCRLLVVTPTRELALQVANEATRLVRYTGLKVLGLVGGASRRAQVEKLKSKNTEIIVGTPGRLLDIFKESKELGDLLNSVQALVLDEADRMLEIGFEKDIEALMGLLPRKGVRKLLFSATYPSDVNHLVRSTLLPGFDIINTIAPGDVRTVAEVRQYFVVAPLYEQLVQLHSILDRGLRPVGDAERKENPTFRQKEELPPFKVMIFLPTTMGVDFYVQILKLMGLPCIYALHGRMTQKEREAISKKFRTSPRGVLITTDVSARGVDYPDVDLVIQIGLATAREQYVHRIGRTARAGTPGEALLFLSPFEADFASELKELPLKRILIDYENAAIELSCIPQVNTQKNNIQINEDDDEDDSEDDDDDDDDVELKTPANKRINTSNSRYALRQVPFERYENELEGWFRGFLCYYSSVGEFLKHNGKCASDVVVEVREFLKKMGLPKMPRPPKSLSREFLVAFEDLKKNVPEESSVRGKYRPRF